jgi:crossover junction endodeoxyribonuclease RuvC
MRTVGVDVGLQGALFFLAPDDTTGEAVDLPVHLLTRGGRNKRELDIAGLVGILELRRPEHAFVEQVGAMPEQGVSSVFAFGECFGAILGVLTALQIPLSLVPPATWKRVLGVPKSKDGSGARPSQLLPAAAQQWGRRRDEALYGARQPQGSMAPPGRPANDDLPEPALAMAVDE